jgi:hypothetical protein
VAFDARNFDEWRNVAAQLTELTERYSSYERSRMAITDVQLVHVDRILCERGMRRGEEFLRMLDERTPVRSFFEWRWDTHARTTGNVAASFSRDRDCFLKQLSETMANLYESGEPDWHTRLTEYLQQAHEKLDAVFGTYEEQFKRNTRDWERVGSVQVTPARPIGALLGRYPLLVEALGRHDLKPEMLAIQVHIPTRFTQDGKSPWESGRTVLQLTRHFKNVRDQYTDMGIDVMIGLSWQMGAVLGKRVGFTIVDSPDLPQNIMGAWYQIINEDGTFNRKRMAYLQEHNELQYRLKCGIIRIPNRQPHD